jgi:hypothetical protein
MLKNIIILYVLLLNLLFAETLHLESGLKQNTLVELYTSEGCSSCPPAEKYLNNLKSNSNIWQSLFPVAFHVDYWDYIGWKDRYATKQFGHRQSRYAALKRASTVYTPAFMVNGSSWRPGIFSNSLPDEKRSAGNLAVSVMGKSIEAHYQLKNKTPLKLNIAVLGMGLKTFIERGENEGRRANHDFVVIGFNSKTSNNLQWNMNLPALHYTQAKNYALVIWVSEINNPIPLQVVGGLLPNYRK